MAHLKTAVPQYEVKFQYTIFQRRIETIGSKLFVPRGARKKRQLSAQLAREAGRAALYAFVLLARTIEEERAQRDPPRCLIGRYRRLLFSVNWNRDIHWIKRNFTWRRSVPSAVADGSTIRFRTHPLPRTVLTVSNHGLERHSVINFSAVRSYCTSISSLSTAESLRIASTEYP